MDHFTTSQLIECYPYGYPGIPESWNLEATMGLTIPLTEFSKLQSFSDLNLRSPFHPVLESLLTVLDRQYIKGTIHTSEGVVFPYHYADGIPKYVLATEVLVKKMETTENPLKNFEKNNLWGYRIWLFKIDPSLNLRDSYAEFCQTKKPDKNSPTLKNVSSLYDLEQKVWRPFVNHYVRSIPNFSGPENTLISDPEEVLCPERMFDQNFLKDLCPEQSDPSRYFNIAISDRAFRRSFPFPNFIFRISHDHASETFYRQIPNALFICVNENQKKIEQLYNQLNDARANLMDESTRLETLDEIQKLERKIRDCENDNIRLLRSISNNNLGTSTYIVSDSVLEKLAERNELLRLREENLRTVVNLRQAYDLDDPRFTEQIFIERTKMIEVYQQVFMNSDLVPPMVKRTRDFLVMTKPEEQFREELHVWKQVTPFADLVISWQNDFDRIEKLDTNFPLMWLVFFVLLNSLYFILGLRANILITGDAGRGKSYVFTILEKITPAGALFSVSHRTANAQNTVNDEQDMGYLEDEAKMERFGLAANGKMQHADPEFKQILTDQIKKTFAFKTDNKGKREAGLDIARCTNAYMMISNECVPPKESPAMTRFIHFIVTDLKRADRDQTAISMGSEDSTPYASKETSRMSKILHYYYIYIVEKAIEAGVLPDVDMTLFDYLSNIIYDELHKLHVPLPNDRTTKKFKLLCRTATIFYGVHMHYFSELGRENRVDEQGNPKKFDFQSLMGIIKWLVCNQEIVVFIMTLLENEFCSVHEAAMIEAAKKDFKFPPSLEVTEKPRFKRVETEGTNETARDYRYIEFTAESYGDIANRIKIFMNPKPSSDDILSMLVGMTRRYIEVYPKEAVVSDSNLKLRDCCCVCGKRNDERVDERIECAFCGRQRHDRCAGKCELEKKYDREMREMYNCCQMCKHIIPEHDRPKEKCPQCKTPCHYKCLRSCQRQGCIRRTCGACKYKCNDCKIDMHFKCIEGHKDLVENTKVKKDVIPAVCMDHFRTGNRNLKRISMALDLFLTTNASVLRKAIKKALEHKHFNEFSPITGFPYVNPKGVKGPMKGDTFHQIFDTLQVKKNHDRLHVLPNYFSSNPFQVVMQKAKMKKEDHDQFQGNYVESGRILNTDMDHFFMNLHFKKQGLGNDASSIVIPHLTKLAVWKLRQTAPEYQDRKDLVFTQDYPKYLVKSIIQECKNREILVTEAREGNSDFAPATDLLVDKRRKTDPDFQLTYQMQYASLSESAIDLGSYKPVEDTKRLENQEKQFKEYLDFEKQLIEEEKLRQQLEIFEKEQKKERERARIQQRENEKKKRMEEELLKKKKQQEEKQRRKNFVGMENDEEEMEFE